MKLNKFLISVVLFLKSSNTRKVDWVEDKLMKKVRENGVEKAVPLSLEDAEMYFQQQFKQWKEEGRTVVRKNIKGETSIIPFTEVEYATFSVKQLDDEGEEGKENYDITQHPAHPNRYENK